MDPRRKEIYEVIENEYVTQAGHMDANVNHLALKNTAAPFVLNLEDEIGNLRLAWQTAAPQAIELELVRIAAIAIHALETVAPFGSSKTHGTSSR